MNQSDIDNEVARLELDGSKISTKVEGRAFINGCYRSAKNGELLDSENPASGKVVAQIASCDKEDVDLAVSAAKNAFESGVWSDLAPNERCEILCKFAALIEENLLEFAVLDTIEAGKPIMDCIEGDVPETVECIKYHAQALDKLYDQIAPTGPGNVGMIVREPVGVVGLIVPWNFPLLMCAWKIGPALATGNCVIVKPSELTSLSAIRLGSLAKQAGIPDGVLNIVPGLGSKAGAALTMHMDVDMVGFTGSTLTGRMVLKASGESNLKRVSLECGGKSPQIIFDDIEDIEKVADQVMSAAFWNMGENCSCGSRLIIQESIKEKLLDILVSKSKSSDWKIEDPTKISCKLGSMISRPHSKKVRDFIKSGLDQGAKLICGGTDPYLESSGGEFIPITIFDNVTNDMMIASEEIFGPVLSVISFKTEQEAIKIANDTKYGLAGSLYTSNLSRAHRVARKIRAGNISVNCFAEGSIATPFSGYKQSGFAGKDKSIFAHEQYTEMKTIWIEI